MSARFDRLVYCSSRRFRTFCGTHEQVAPLRRPLEITKKNNGHGRIAEIDNPGIAGDAYDFDILILRHKADANCFADDVAVWKETFGETAVHNSEARVPFVIGLAEIAALKQVNSKSSEETGRDPSYPHANPRGCVG